MILAERLADPEQRRLHPHPHFSPKFGIARHHSFYQITRRCNTRSPIGNSLPESGPALMGLAAKPRQRGQHVRQENQDQRGLFEADHLYLDLVGRDSF